MLGTFPLLGPISLNPQSGESKDRDFFRRFKRGPRFLMGLWGTEELKKGENKNELKDILSNLLGFL